MRQFVLSFVLVLGTQAQAQQAAMPPGVRDVMVSGGLSVGRTHRVAEHCGASADALKAYKARFDAGTRGGEELYASLGIDIEQTFAQGRRDGDLFYAAVKSTPDREALCSQTLALVGGPAAATRQAAP